MKRRLSDEMKQLLNPYLFILKEDNEDKTAPQTYSLQMLQVGHIETLKTPDQIHLFPLLDTTEEQLLAHGDQSYC